MTQKQIAVIGGGIVGVCTAYFLAKAGHEVVVIEQHHNVAHEASFANAGIVGPGYAIPWAAPGMPQKILSRLFRSKSPVLLKPTLDRAMWRWVRRWLSECELDRYRVNTLRMQRLAIYSGHLLQQMRENHPLNYEQTMGVLQLLRTKQDIEMAEPALALLAEGNVSHRMLDAEAAYSIEPALARHTPLAGALYFPQDASGNCPLFTRQIRHIAESIGAQFYFSSAVNAIAQEGNRVAMRIDEKTFSADAVVVAAGSESPALLKPLGIDIPLYPVRGYSATALIKNPDAAPLAALIDEAYKVAIARMGMRIRISGLAELGPHTTALKDAAQRTLIKAGADWFPHAANYNTATLWCGTYPMLPDGPPLLGLTSVKNVFVNIGHGSAGWTMAMGSGKVLADIISEHAPDIDMDGLTLARYA